MATYRLVDLASGHDLGELGELPPWLAEETDHPQRSRHIHACRGANLDWLRTRLPQSRAMLGLDPATDGPLTIGCCPGPQTEEWRISGRVLYRNGRAAPGIHVAAWDKDLLKQDDPLGYTFTNERGAFALHFREADFKNPLALIDVEHNPDVYLEAYDYRTGRLKRTAVLVETPREHHFDVKVSFESSTVCLRPVVGTYYIEEDRLLDEIEDLRRRLLKSPNEAQDHFLLALCYTELVKHKLRQSQWQISWPDGDRQSWTTRALDHLDRARSLEPELTELLQQYRTYIKKLQALPL
jgi:hypothetical protein